MLVEFEYVVWFQNPLVEPDDEDFEWPAVFVVSASNADEACAWGDVLAQDYAGRSGQRLLWSMIDDDPTLDSRLPRVANGERPSDTHIGW